MVEEVCPKCGLPKSICVCGVIEAEAKLIKVYISERRFKKPMTVIEGIDKKTGKSISKQLKRKLACGGTYKEGRIELQGNHISKIKELLKEFGFDEERIEVS